MEGVGGEPHVFAVAGDGVGFLESAIVHAAGVENRADVIVGGEEPDGVGGAGLRWLGGAHDGPVAGWDAVGLSLGVCGDAGVAVAFGEGLGGGGDVPAIDDDERFVVAEILLGGVN